jgi:hypothetical protein
LLRPRVPPVSRPAHRTCDGCGVHRFAIRERVGSSCSRIGLATARASCLPKAAIGKPGRSSDPGRSPRSSPSLLRDSNPPPSWSRHRRTDGYRRGASAAPVPVVVSAPKWFRAHAAWSVDGATSRLLANAVGRPTSGTSTGRSGGATRRQTWTGSTALVRRSPGVASAPPPRRPGPCREDSA